MHEVKSIYMHNLDFAIRTYFDESALYAITASMIYDPDIGSNREVETSLELMGHDQFIIGQWMCQYGQLLIQIKYLIEQVMRSCTIIEYTTNCGVLLLTVVKDV